MEQTKMQQIPSHVPVGRVFDFDLYALTGDPAVTPFPQQGMRTLLRSAPDLFFTPANGGHWVATRYDIMSAILQDPARFSAQYTTVPRLPGQMRLIPLNLDPPEHTPYRQVLMRYFSRQPVQAMEDRVRVRARDLIAAVVARGECDFLAEIGAPLPVYVFMDMMGWPLEKFATFRAIVVEWFSIPSGPRRAELAQIILGHLRELIAARREDPRDDLTTRLISEEIDGRTLEQSELESICFLLFLAGLDTVANAAGFAFNRLSRMSSLQNELAADPALIAPFIEEVLRACGVVNTIRTATQDVDIDGVCIKSGDAVMCPLLLSGLDERANDDPESFDIHRKAFNHLTFSTGPHLCVGHLLARLELRVLVEEWIKAIPQFGLAHDDAVDVKIGSIVAVTRLNLAWLRGA
jgi:cytochrome P450